MKLTYFSCICILFYTSGTRGTFIFFTGTLVEAAYDEAVLSFK